jgi:hypothetical protein
MSPKSLQNKNAKISTTELNLKVQNIYIKPLLNAKTPSTTTYVLIVLVKRSQKYCNIFG